MTAIATKSIREQIVEEIVLALQGLDVAGRNVQRVWRAWREPASDGELPFVVVWPGPETKVTGKDGASYRFYFATIRVDVYVWLRVSGDNDEDADETATRALADIEKAVIQRPLLKGGSGSASSLTHFTHLVDNDVILGRQEQAAWIAGVRVGLEIQYRHRDDNPDGNT